MARRKKASLLTTRRRGGNLSRLTRKALTLGIVTLGALLILGFLGYAQLLSYLQGENFRHALEKELANKAQATGVELAGNLGVETNRVSLPGIRVQRPGLLQEAEGKRLHAELKRAALLDKHLHLTRLIVEEGSLTLDINRAGAPLPPIRPSASGFLSRLAPTSARLDKLDINDLTATLLYAGQRYALTDSSLTATPAPKQGQHAWSLRLNGGRVHTPLPILGDSNLKGAQLTLTPRVTSLSDARLMLSPGELIINAVHEQQSGNWSADIRANSIDIARLIGEDWKKRLSGVLIGRLQMDGQANGLRSAEGRLSLQQGVLEALPFLSNLPVGDSHPYRSLRLEKATAHLSYPHTDAARNIQNAWLLDDIDLRAEGGWLRVRGHALADADGSLAGTLLIGLPEAVANQFIPPGSPLHRSIFNAEGDPGYLWLRLNLSGSLSHPQEDLSVRMMTLMATSLPETAIHALRDLLLPGTKTSSPESPSTPPTETEAPEADTPGRFIRGAGDVADDLINTGLRSLF